MLRNETVWLVGSTTQTAGRPLASVRADAGTSITGAEPSWMRSRHGGPEPHRLGRLREPDLDLEGPGRGIRLRRNLPHAAGGPHGRVVGQGDLNHRVARARADELGGHVEHGVAPALAGDLARSSARPGPPRRARRPCR